MNVRCVACKLREKALFKALSERELRFVSTLKIDQVGVDAKVDFVRQGQQERVLYTLLEGWAFRHKRLVNGKRQIFDILLPGDLIGLQSYLLGTTEYSVQALTPVSLCVLDGNRFRELFESHRELAYALATTQAENEWRHDTRLAFIGHKNAAQGIGYLMLDTFDRLHRRGMASGSSCHFPLHRQHLADALGISGTHVHRSLGEIRERNLAAIQNNTLVIFDREKLVAFTGYSVPEGLPRRLIL